MEVFGSLIETHTLYPIYRARAGNIGFTSHTGSTCRAVFGITRGAMKS